MTPAPPTESHRHTSRDRTERVRDIVDRWQHGEPPDAAAVLTADPDLASDRPLALELAYEEYCLRAEAAQPVNADSFCRRFPFRTSLMRLIAVHSFLDRHPEVLGPTRPARRFARGDVLADFRVLRPLGQGGFSDVYLAEELTAGRRPVVVKVTTADGSEADASGPLSHPHLMPVFSSPRAGEFRLVVMPFYGTATLEDVLPHATVLEAVRNGSHPDDPPFTSERPFGIRPQTGRTAAVCAVARGVASALEYLHARGLAHRDIKPSNVLLGAGGHPYLLDFNLSSGPLAPTRLGGTVPYMAPEAIAAVRARDAGGVDWRAADVYSFAVLLWEQLTGVHPFLNGSELAPTADRDTVLDLMANRQQAAGRNGWEQFRRLPRRVRRALDRCLSADPRRRPSAAELVTVFAPPTRRRWVWTVAAAGLVTAGLVAAVWLTRAPTAAVQPVEPDLSDPFARGKYLCDKGQFDLAATAFKDAGDERQDGRAYACAAYCFIQKGCTNEAEVMLRRAIAVGEDSADVRANLAYCRMYGNDYAQCLAECDRALAKNPKCRAALVTRSLVRLRLHEMNKVPLTRSVGDDLRTALEIPGPTGGQLWESAARLYLLLPNPTAADLDSAASAALSARRMGKSAKNMHRLADIHPPVSAHPIFRLAAGDDPVEQLVDDPGDPRLANPLP